MLRDLSFFEGDTLMRRTTIVCVLLGVMMPGVSMADAIRYVGSGDYWWRQTGKVVCSLAQPIRPE